jgi:hypothetical protein
MFKKDHYSEVFFNLVEFIKDNYIYYSELYKFNPKQYRNDISFSVAKHILDGFEHEFNITLPPVLTIQGSDFIEKIKPNGEIILTAYDLKNQYIAASMSNTDLHVMNKKNILDHFDSFLTLL